MHAFTILNVKELDMAGTKVKMVQLRNPWEGANHGWKGDYSKTKGGASTKIS